MNRPPELSASRRDLLKRGKELFGSDQRRDVSDQNRSRMLAPSIDPYDGVWGRANIYHLLRRTVVAPTVAEVVEGEEMKREDLVDRLLNTSLPLPGPPRFVTECLNASALAWDSGRVDIIDTFFDELRRWWIGLMINTRFSMRERMTLFWHNHFAVNARVIPDSRYLYLQNQLFRRYALGNFRELVRGVTIDKGMLHFLDGKNSKADYRNENYARELQELFTIGIADNDGNPNYSQQDVVEVARTLTGWDWVGLGMQGDVINSILTGHDLGNKIVYGETINGQTEGGGELTRLLDIIFAKEETARYVIRKLYRFFVYTDTTLTPIRPIPAEIEEEIITPLATTFRQNNWEIAPVLRQLFLSRHFNDPAVMATTIRSPIDLLAGTIRSITVGTFSGDAADFALQYCQERAILLDQNLFYPPGVQGWNFYRSWISSTTLPKRKFYTDELVNRVSSTITDRLSLVLNGPVPRSGSWTMDVVAFAKQFDSYDDPEGLVDAIVEHLLAFPPSATLRNRLLTEMTSGRPYEWGDLDDTLRAVGLRGMLRYLMRSTAYQLM